MDRTDRVPVRRGPADARRGRHRLGPWLAPAVVVVEVALVWSGLLSLRWAVLSGIALEVVLAAVVGGRLVVATKGFRSSRAAGNDPWTAAEEGLASVVPRPLARFIVLEPRLWWALVRWCTGRSGAGGSASFGYHRALRLLFWAIFTYACVELIVVDAVLALSVSDRTWLWISLGLHLYALVALLGFWASFVTRPHVVGDELLLRDGVFGEVAIPYPAIVEVRATTTNAGGMGGRSGLRVDASTRTARLSVGPSTTVTLSLDPSMSVRTGRGEELALARFLVTVDRPDDFVVALRGRLRELHVR